MFAPGIGIAEDPATGSAAVALAAYLAARRPESDATLKWVIEQGFEMGRPSILHAEADKEGGTVVRTRVGGSTVLMTEGSMNL
jgi:trans-2,3-dihydro-3-hydroxyanthranilate isomerase